MADINEAGWYSMMGLSKVFLRNFIIGCFIVCLGTIGTLASVINSLIKEKNIDDKAANMLILELSKKCSDVAELKNKEYLLLLKEAILNQKEIDNTLHNMSRNKKQ